MAKKLKDAAKNSFVWLQEPDWLYYPGRVESVSGSSVKIRVIAGQGGTEEDIDVDGEQPLVSCHEDSLHAVEDLVTLPDCCEPALLHNTRLRYWLDQIYVFIGPVLIATNPYKSLPLYTPAMMEFYRGRDPADMPPHLFALAERSLLDLAQSKKDQTFVISGESGAGKSEATKFIVFYLAESSMKKAGGAAGDVVKKLLEMSPVLEAFGNAKTVRNNNSSRFGKWLQVFFDNNGIIQAAKVTKYLLEKSRVALPLPNERNYHIFYNMITGLKSHNETLYQSLGIGEVDDYDYLTKGQCTSVPGIDDVEDCGFVLQSLDTLGVSKDDQLQMWKLVASCMLLGNVKVEGKGEGSEISESDLEVIAKHMDVDVGGLKKALTERMMKTAGDTFQIPRTQEQATDTRDALAKFVYGKVFDWTVEKCNASVTGGILEDPKKAAKLQCIGVLDIFGFESLVENSYEQLNINYTNEKLQQYFNNFVFTLEKKIYSDEKVPFADIKFPDNQDTLDLIEKKPGGLLAMLDEECVTPKGSDNGYKDKVLQAYAKSPILKRPKPGKTTADCYTVVHFAGEVMYHTTGWLDKNRDTLGMDLVSVLSSSANAFTASLVSEELEASKGGGGGKAGKKTIASQFKQNLTDLMASLDKGRPFFVRCIKPNLNKAAHDFNGELVLQQLRYSGMLEAIRVRRVGFPFRYLYKDFLHRFQICSPSSKDSDPKAHAKKLMEGSKVKEENFRLGLTKMFMDNTAFQHMEALRVQCLQKSVVLLQKMGRGLIKRKWFKKLKQQIPYIEAVSRGYNIRKCIATCKRLKQVLITGTVEDLQAAISDAQGVTLPRVQELVKQAAEAMNNVLQRDAVRNQLVEAVKSHRRQELEAALFKAKEISLPPEVPEMRKATELMQLLVKQDDALQALKELVREDSPDEDALAKAAETLKSLGIDNVPELDKAAEILKASASRREAQSKLKSAVEARDQAALEKALGAARAFPMLAKEVEQAEKLLDNIVAEKEALDALKSALVEKTKAGLTGAIKKAQAIGLEHPLLTECQQTLASQLELLDLQEALEIGLDSRDAASVKSALAKMDEKKIKIPADLVRNCREFLERYELELKVKAQIPQACESNSLEFVTEVLEGCQKLNLRHPQLDDLIQREDLLRRDDELRIILEEMEDSPGRNASERKAQIANLAKAIQEFRSEVTPNVEKARLKLASAKEVEKVEQMLKSAIVTRNLAMLETSLFRAGELKHISPNTKLGVEVRDSLTGAKEMAEAAAKGDANAVLNSVEKRSGATLKARLAGGPKAAHHQTLKEEKASKRKKSILSTSALVLTGEAVQIEGQRNLRNTAGRNMIQNAGDMGVIEKKIMAMVEEDKMCEEDDEDDIMKLVVLLLKNELPGLFNMYTDDDLEAFEDFISTYEMPLCPVMRVAKMPVMTELIPKHSLTVIDETNAKHCSNLFKNLLGFMGLRKLPFPETLVEEMVQTGMQIHAIRDEIFLMLLRQTNENHVSDSVILKDVWGIVYVCLMAFKPSDLLYPYFIAYVLKVCLNEKTLDKDKRWPQFCLRLAVGNEIPTREQSLMKADLDKRVRGAIVVPKVCPVSGKTWYITQREIDMYGAKGQKVPDKAPECRVQLESVTKKTLADAKSGAKPLPSYMRGTSAIKATTPTARGSSNLGRTGSKTKK
jgi:myosin heavy subunit